MSARDIFGGVVAGAGAARQMAIDAANSRGAVPLNAAWSQGVRELGNAFGKALPDTPQEPALGQIGQPTPGEVTAAKGVYDNQRDVTPPVADGPEMD